LTVIVIKEDFLYEEEKYPKVMQKNASSGDIFKRDLLSVILYHKKGRVVIHTLKSG